ncbi:hypothetical protein P3S68_000141 [Capsicum galapagoense]
MNHEQQQHTQYIPTKWKAMNHKTSWKSYSSYGDESQDVLGKYRRGERSYCCARNVLS